MDNFNYYSLLSDDEPTAQQKAMSLSNALRGQQMLGQVGQLAGATPVGQMAQGVSTSANEGQKLLAKIAETRRQRDLEQQKIIQQGQYQQGELDNRQQELAQQDAYHKGILATGKYSATPYGTLNTRTGELESYATGGGAALPPKLAEKEFSDFARNVSTYQGRANLNTELQKRMNSAERLEALILGPGGQIQNLTPQQVREAGTGLANLISSGSMSLQQIEELTPESLTGKFASLKQKILNEPQGADAQAFLQNMLDTAAREKNTVLQQIKKGQLQAIPNYAKLRKIDPQRFESILKAPGVGIDPSTLDENGLSIETQKAGAAAGAQAHPQADAALQWAKAHPEDKRAAEILKRLGAKP